MRKFRYLVVGMALLVGAPVTAQDNTVALVLQVQGEVQVQRTGLPPAAAVVGERLAAGDQVMPASGGRAVLITITGATQRVTEATTVSAPQGAEPSNAFTRAMTTIAQAAATDATMGGRQGMIRPIPGQTKIIAPRNALTVQSERPTFTWTASPGKTYDVMVRKVEGGRPIIFEVGSDTTWTLPDSEEALESGATYAWTVFVGGRNGGRPQPQQEFRIIDFDESLELTQFMDEITAFGLDPMSDGLFLTVIALRDLDLFYDAGEAINGIEQQGSMDADLYMLKGEILATLGREDQARDAFDAADRLKRAN